MSFEQLSEIEAFVPVSPQLATSGQPTSAQFEVIKAAGYEAVVNLAMPTSSNWVPEEPEILANLGLDYFPMPVLWENPTLEDFDQFCAVLEQNQERKLWVHCAKNMRVSAMVYLYNRVRAKLPHEVAWRYVEPVWQPNPVWFGFIEATIELYEL
ncbi:protein tyrosine phosphatase family protein [filamentous cyanobacterium LEGE 11480]|uniref:Protein tyrosine phosphatase family protein n=1 Tax=Romeriopsis navalis LEGE 11480 TaxID=2777977 RepID=A0A928Z571_9CYAN|nr:protein tyrosine phosphatase family protein [Romeriopsis navalis]MBE9032509.1 protein tyrosine phosphatase family protein [Romeriopsis navalis LEGE 11480]